MSRWRDSTEEQHTHTHTQESKFSTAGSKRPSPASLTAPCTNSHSRLTPTLWTETTASQVFLWFAQVERAHGLMFLPWLCSTQRSPPSRGISSGRRWSQCRTHCLALAPPQPFPKAEPKTRTWVPVAYLGGDSKKHKWGCGERKTGKGEKAIWCAGPMLSFHLCYRGMCLTFLIFPLSCRNPIIGVVANAQRAKRSCPPVWKTISNYPYFLKKLYTHCQD